MNKFRRRYLNTQLLRTKIRARRFREQRDLGSRYLLPLDNARIVVFFVVYYAHTILTRYCGHQVYYNIIHRSLARIGATWVRLRGPYPLQNIFKPPLSFLTI